jgi:hypothetical protein
MERSVTEQEDEEVARTGRPNAYWAKVRAEQGEQSDTYTGSFRGVPTPHAGHRTVHASDTKGDMAHCWCGEPVGHDWPGKASGLAHPKEGTVSTMVELNLRRNDLRGYHRDLQEVILQAVNTYSLKFRQTKNGIMLYPPRGSSAQPLRINERNSDRQVKVARTWLLHNAIGLTDDFEPVSPLVADPQVIADDLMRRGMEMHARDESEPLPEERVVEEQSEGESIWLPHVYTSGEVSDRFETNGKQWRCRECLGTDHEYVSDHTRGLAGHQRTCHDETRSLYSETAIATRVETGRFNRITSKVGDAIELLAEAIGYQGDRERIAELEEQVDMLHARVAELEAECEESAAAIVRAEEAETRLALLREALEA